MNWFEINFVEGAVVLVIGGLLGYWLRQWKIRNLQARAQLKEQNLLEEARRKADNILLEARLAANEEALKIREQTEKCLTQNRRELNDFEQRLTQRELLINHQLEGLVQQEKCFRNQEQALAQKQAELEEIRRELSLSLEQRRTELQRLSQLSAGEARALLLKEVEQDSLRDAADLSRHVIENAKLKAEEQARRIITIAIQRYAGNHTFETTTATVALQGDEIKGRIIGREGRNIRAFEAATGVTVLIDDTPNAVVLSGFDPVRREIAREAMQRLILDGRIHPTRIEEIVSKVREEMEETILKAGEEAVYKAGLPPLHMEIVRLLGTLRFRQSFSQNILEHSVEVAHIMGLLAAELGLDVLVAKRSGLLHDIGKGLNHEIEGSHAIIGADFIKRYGESDEVINAVASHHDEVPHTNLYGILVSAADAISASRPGARSETMTTYIKRLENLEKIGLSFAGVEKCFAVQAGRELRVIVQPEQVNDDQAAALARSVVRKIEDELQYPGQIRVTVVRETRCVEFAK
ncbi:MAG: ribonuclease Y [Verrucomicrobiota bacterium]